MNDRGQYGARVRVGADPRGPRSAAPWVIGGLSLAVVGLALASAHAKWPRLTAHEREVRAWQTEFPGLPWYADEVRDSRQLDMWERARDHWERTR